MDIFINKKTLKVKECKTFKSKLKGLMFKKEKLDYGIVLYRCNSIHTFFMKQPIDICITDKNNKIIFLRENLKANKIIFPIKNGYFTYELPLNSVKYLKINETLGGFYETNWLWNTKGHWNWK